jgi:hypothetical protein
MLKKTITYEDLDGNPITEDFYFNLSKAELAEMELAVEGGLSDHLQKLVKSTDGAEIIATFKKIIGDSIGRRSEDGKRFIKSEEIKQEFFQSDAYSTLFMELVTDENAATNFVNGIMPKDLGEAVARGERVTDVPLPDGETKDDRPAWVREDREPTREEMANMSKEELMEAFRRKSQNSKE